MGCPRGHFKAAPGLETRSSGLHNLPLAYTLLSPTYPISLGLEARGRGNSAAISLYTNHQPHGRQDKGPTGGVSGHSAPARVEMGF